MKKLIYIFGLLSFLFAKSINIGVIMPMSGPIAGYGQITYEGIKLANKLEPKLKNGDTINLVLIDNKGDKVETVNSTTRLISLDKVVGIIGPLTSTNVAASLSIADKKKIPLIAPVATNDKLNYKKKYGNRVCFIDSFQGSVIANYAFNKLKFKSAVLIVDQAQVYTLGLGKAFKKSFKKLGGKVLKQFKISSGDKDFKAIVSQIKKLNPDFIFLPLYHSEAALIARQVRQAGLKQKMFSGDGAANPTFIELGGKAVDGYMYTDFFDYNAPPTKKSKDFIKTYKKQMKKEELNSFTALSADAYYIMVNAMNKCKNPQDSVCINKEIKKVKNFEGVSGIININKKGNAKRSAVIKIIQNGKGVYKDTVNP